MSREYLVDGPNAEYGLARMRRDSPISEEEKARMRAEYGYVRTYFKLHPERYARVQRAMNQARFGTTYDEYLARSLVYAVVAGVLGVTFGIGLTYVLADLGVLAELRNPLSVRGDLVVWVGANRTLIAGIALAIVVGSLLAGGTFLGRYYYPNSVVSTRRQKIDIVLPHAIVYMYALSHGGMSLLEVMNSLAASRDTYGEVANEFEMIVNDIELFGSDLYTALQNARNLTPSENLEQFLDDMISVLDSGGNITRFFENESETYLREAEEAQEDFLETLALLAEVFVVGFVAAPLFLIVVLVVIGIMGGQTVSQLGLLVYGLMPVAMVAFLVLLDVLGEPFGNGGGVVEAPGDGDDVSLPEGDERAAPYRNTQRKLAVLDVLENPLAAVRKQPVLSTFVTIPLAGAVFAAAVLTGTVELSLAAMESRPIVTTTWLFVAPFVVVAAPLTVFVELKRRHENEIARRFPDTLNILSSANKMGIPLVDALDLVSRWSEGVVARELRTVRNDIEWNHDTTAALLAFGARLRVPQLARTMKLLAEGIRSSGDLSRVLSIAAEDARNRQKMERSRRRELSSYIAVVAIGFLVYLLVIVMLDASFLTPLAGIDAPESAPTGGVPLGFATVPVELYRAVFFHSALIQAVGTGLLAGKLAEDDVASGLKYSLALVAVTMAAFAFV